MDQEIYYWGKNLFRHVSIVGGVVVDCPTYFLCGILMCNVFATFFGSNQVQVPRGPRSTNAREKDRRCLQVQTAFTLNS